MDPLIHSLVAHRGYPLHYPENTLEGLRAAVDTGARWLEFDVQLSSDGVPMVIHDVSLQRTAGMPANVMDLDRAQLETIEVNESQRFGETFQGVRIPALDDIRAILRSAPEVSAMVEIKSQSLERYGVDTVIQPIIEALRPVLRQCVLISFDRDAIELARAMGVHRIGWVLSQWSREILISARSLAPDYLICSHGLLPKTGPLWAGSWRWMVYQTCDPQLAIGLRRRGVEMIETDAIGEMRTSLIDH